MVSVAAGLGHRSHDATGVAAHRSIVQAGLHNEFLQRIDRWDGEIGHRSRADGVRVDAINDYAVGKRTLPVDVQRNIAASQLGGVFRSDPRFPQSGQAIAGSCGSAAVDCAPGSHR